MGVLPVCNQVLQFPADYSNIFPGELIKFLCNDLRCTKKLSGEFILYCDPAGLLQESLGPEVSPECPEGVSPKMGGVRGSVRRGVPGALRAPGTPRRTPRRTLPRTPPIFGDTPSDTPGTL